MQLVLQLTVFAYYYYDCKTIQDFAFCYSFAFKSQQLVIVWRYYSEFWDNCQLPTHKWTA